MNEDIREVLAMSTMSRRFIGKELLHVEDLTLFLSCYRYREALGLLSFLVLSGLERLLSMNWLVQQSFVLISVDVMKLDSVLGLLVLGMLFSHLLVQNQRLGDQHPRNADHGNQEEENGKELLEAIRANDSLLARLDGTTIQSHVNHHGDN